MENPEVVQTYNKPLFISHVLALALNFISFLSLHVEKEVTETSRVRILLHETVA
jgi:hypothetical protein